MKAVTFYFQNLEPNVCLYRLFLYIQDLTKCQIHYKNGKKTIFYHFYSGSNIW